MKLTGVSVIETGVVNRGEGLGNIATVKKIRTVDGEKGYFSPQSYKRALWGSLQENRGWSLPFVTAKRSDKDVIQKIGTIIDSEEFDFAGTMVAKVGGNSKKNYERLSTLLVDTGISVNDYDGIYKEFMTNAAIAKLHGENEGSIINKEIFHGIYLLPFGIEIDRVGVQEITTIDTKIESGDPVDVRIKKIYKALCLEDEATDERIGKWMERVESIEYYENKKKQKVTKIVLTVDERVRRIRDVLEMMGELARRIEGSIRNLAPTIAVFSLDYASPKYQILIKDYIGRKLSNGDSIDKKELTEELNKLAVNDGKTIRIADYMDYKRVINEIIKKIEAYLEADKGSSEQGE